MLKKIINIIRKIRIVFICWQFKISNYHINHDLSIDCNNNIFLNRKNLKKLPLKFNQVFGSFYCDNNRLTSLKGSPRFVGGHFSCDNNLLTSLKDGPETVNLNYSCSYNNQLESLEGYPIEKTRSRFDQYSFTYTKVNEIFILFDEDFKKYKASLDYYYIREKGIDKKRLTEALEEIGKKCPDRLCNYDWVEPSNYDYVPIVNEETGIITNSETGIIIFSC